MVMCSYLHISLLVSHWGIFQGKHLITGLPWQLSSKESACQCRIRGFDLWIRKIPWRRKWLPTPVFLPGKSHGQRSLVDYSPWGHKELAMTEETQHACKPKLTIKTGWVLVSSLSLSVWQWPISLPPNSSVNHILKEVFLNLTALLPTEGQKMSFFSSNLRPTKFIFYLQFDLITRWLSMSISTYFRKTLSPTTEVQSRALSSKEQVYLNTTVFKSFISLFLDNFFVLNNNIVGHQQSNSIVQ